jgi:nucleoside-diphosphate-sugar epimerase
MSNVCFFKGLSQILGLILFNGGLRMVLVTGAAGKTARAVIRALIAKGEAVRALIHRPGEGVGAQEMIVGDMFSQAVLDQAVRGAKSIYFICFGNEIIG